MTWGLPVPPRQKSPNCGEPGDSMSRLVESIPSARILGFPCLVAMEIAPGAVNLVYINPATSHQEKGSVGQENEGFFTVKDLAKDQRLESLLELVHHGLSKVERSKKG